MNKPTVLTSAGDIDLTRHGVIEAHAGTGKTHTIEKLVLIILEQPETAGKPGFIHIRNILLVTFTEKASGELRQRIRKGLEDRIKELREKKSGGSAALMEHLEDCLNNMHEALIGTIHAVCLRLLQTWPFETGVQFKTEITDDDEGLETALRQSMRIDWQDADAETGIPWALDKLQEQGQLLEAKHFALIRQTAKELLDKEHSQVDKDAGLTCIADVKNNLDLCFANSTALKKPLKALITQAENLLKSPAGLNEERMDFVSSLMADWKANLESAVLDPERVLQTCWVKAHSEYKAIKTDLIAKKLAIVSIRKKNPLVEPFAEAFAAFANDSAWGPVLAMPHTGGKLLLAFVCDAAKRLATRWNREKREKGLISYQDMLRLMREAVQGDNNAFVNALHSRLRFGIIDEFQDTSILQWEIFQRIFITHAPEKGPKIFIVGDPKQSIYAFMGADVQSYLQAKETIGTAGGRIYYLDKNFRSLPETIAGCNAILSREKPDDINSKDWFAFENTEKPGISYPDATAGDKGKCAEAPEREPKGPPVRLSHRPVQVMVLKGNQPVRLRTMATMTSAAIRKLRRTEISVPNGMKWDNLTIDYKDVAIIVENRFLVAPFLEQLQADGIPAVKYKMEGVFQSAMARDLHAILRAILHSEGKPAPRLAALLTSFFNRRPEDIDPEKDLEPCTIGGTCSGDNVCIAHACAEWTGLAGTLKWARLFKRIQERTGVRERLITLTDGERHLADLRQVIDYCIEKLYRENVSLEQLVEHLKRLYDEKESAGRDKNLHTLASDKSSVKVMTMHAAKGLEFPVVFVVTGRSAQMRKGPNCLVGTNEDRKRLVFPYVSTSDVGDPEKKHFLLQATRERRRLLYVALTRAQAMLFVPMHLEDTEEDTENEAVKEGPQPEEDTQKLYDSDLTPKLQKLLDQKNPWVVKFREDDWKPAKVLSDETSTDIPVPTPLLKIPAINLFPLICRQTSYSQLSRNAASCDREADRSEEEDEKEEGTVPKGKKGLPVLPGGKATGDALHLAIEELLLKENVLQAVNDNSFLHNHVAAYLERNGVCKRRGDPATLEAAVTFAAESIKNALTSGVVLPKAGSVSIAGLPRSSRIPEMEFLLVADGLHWVHGYMDLVFRVENKKAQHPWQYFVLDWKSNQLEKFDEESVGTCMAESHYDLQAKIYCHALDKYLKGVLGDGYDQKENLGGAVYVFLRGIKGDGMVPVVNTWRREAEPDNDEKFVQSCLAAL